MGLMSQLIRCAFAGILLLTGAGAFADAQQWSAQKANAWYAQQRWLIGSDYIPSDAINQLEMWQADTFNPGLIDKELGWAESLAVHAMRVFLPDKPWEQNPAGFKQRLDPSLGSAAKHRIKPLLELVVQ